MRSLLIFIVTLGTLTAPAPLCGQQDSPAEAKQIAGPLLANAPAPPKPPFPALTKAEEDRLDQLLVYWEQRSDKIKTYSCRFTRYEYDPVFGPKDFAKTQSMGFVRYAAPDRGEFHVDSSGEFQPPQAAGDKPTWDMQATDVDEHWVSDGSSIYELNKSKKQLIEVRLPPEMQGKGISDGPLPFMFGAKREKMLKRYWLRELPPPNGVKGQYWLEAWPKFREDAMNFQKVQVILDEKEFLPVAMQVFPPGYHPEKNAARTSYAFNNRQVNNTIHRTQQFLKRFISPNVPDGWKKIVENYGEPTANAPAATANKAGDVRK